jgi:hypothetical protein
MLERSVFQPARYSVDVRLEGMSEPLLLQFIPTRSLDLVENSSVSGLNDELHPELPSPARSSPLW